MSAQRSHESSLTRFAKPNASFKELVKRINRDPAEDRRARERLFQDILELARWKRIPRKRLFKRAGKSYNIYYKWRYEGDVPRRSTLFKLWDALELTEADKERWSKKKILLSSEALALWEALGKAERVLRETLPLLRLPPQLFRYRQVHIGRRIVELRRARGWNQTEFAEVVGLSKGLIYKLETARWPSDPVMVWSYLERIAKGLGTTLEEILSWV